MTTSDVVDEWIVWCLAVWDPLSIVSSPTGSAARASVDCGGGAGGRGGVGSADTMWIDGRARQVEGDP